MGMNIPTGDGDDHPVMSAINTTPLVDVMLVLLIIFLITVPVITKTVNLDLPKATNIATQTKPENITVAIDRQGKVYWKESLVPDNQVLADLIRSGVILLLQLGVGTIEHRKMLRAIELLGTRVAPQVRAEIARRAAGNPTS